MKKRLLFLLFTLVLCVGLLPLNAQAATYGDLTYTVYNGKITITDCKTSATSVTIPATIDGLPVTAIGEYAFDGCHSLTSVTIPGSVTSIKYRAFYNCDSLTSVTIPDGVTSIGSGAFLGCSSLTSVTIPGSVTYIWDNAFQYCSSLTSVTIPNGVTSIGDGAFWNCSSLTSVTIPGSVTSIGNSVFSGCYSLQLITVDTGNMAYQSIDGVLFSKDGKTLVTVPDGKSGAYTIPNGVTSIGENASIGCYSRVTIPDGVTSIGRAAFSGSSLTSIYFTGNAPSFSFDAFYEVTATAYYPSGDSTWTENVRQNYRGTITWVAYDNNDRPWETLPSHIHCVCAGETDICDHTTHEDVTFVEWTDELAAKQNGSGKTAANSLPKSTGNYYLAKDVTVSSSTSESDGDIVLCLNGHDLTLPDINGLYVKKGSLKICDCKDCAEIIRDNRENFDTNIIYIAESATMEIYGGKYALDGKGLCISNYGQLNIYGGTYGIGVHTDGKTTVYHAVFNNDSYNNNADFIVMKGGTLSVHNGTFTSCNTILDNRGTTKIEGGTFTTKGYEATSVTVYSPCVRNSGRLTFSSARIDSEGNGIANEGSFTIKSGTISSGIQSNGKKRYGCSAIENTGLSSIYGGNLSGYYGINNKSANSGTTKDGGVCEIINGTITGSEAGIYNGGTVSGSGTSRKVSRGIVKISNAPTIDKIIINYPKSIVFEGYPYTGKTIDCEINLSEDLKTGDIISERSGASVKQLRSVDDTYVFLCISDNTVLNYAYCGAEGQNGENLRWKLSPEGVLTISGTGSMKNCGTSGGQPWSYDKTRIYLKKVVIEKGVTSIGSAAFSYNEYLENVSIPEGLLTIEDYAFEGSYALEKINLPVSLTKIGRNTFVEISKGQPPKSIQYAGCMHQWSKVTVGEQYYGSFEPDCKPNTNQDDGDCMTPLYCSVCSQVIRSGHSFTKYISNNDASCTTDGTKTATCDYCDETNQVTDEGSATGHDFSGRVKFCKHNCGEKNPDWVEPGITLTGQVTSYNPRNAVTIQLMQGSTEKYRTTIAAATSGKGKVTQSFSIEEIAAGTYDLVISKPGYLTYTVTGIVVGEENIDLTKSTNAAISTITLISGDLNDDDKINGSDLLIFQSEFGKTGANIKVPLADLNDDGKINSSDLLIFQSSFGKTKSACTVAYNTQI